MHPLIKQNFYVVHLKKAENIRKFDILLYKRDNGNFVIHRVMKTKGDTLTMCGDNQFVFEKDILPSQVLAKVSAIYKKDRLVKLDSTGYNFYVKMLPLRRFWLKNLCRARNMVKKIFKGR